MAISSEARSAGPFIGTGSETEFPFSFKILSADHVKVVLSKDGGATEEEVSKTSFSVGLNADQDNNPGGKVTLNSKLGSGERLSVISDAPYLQPMVLTNRGGFYPETLNESADNIVIQTQQLKGQLEKALIVPSTSTDTPQQVMQRLMNAQTEAAQYASAASASAAEARAIEKRLTSKETSLETAIINAADAKIVEIANEGESQRDSVSTTGHDWVTAVNEEGSAQRELVTATGNEQVERVQIAAQQVITQWGVACSEYIWQVGEFIPAGSVVTLPAEMKYVVSRHHLRLYWNGLAMMLGKQFSEVGDSDTESDRFVTLMPLNAGDWMMAHIIPLGRGDVNEAIVKVDQVSDALADLSAKVVYKSDQTE